MCRTGASPTCPAEAVAHHRSRAWHRCWPAARSSTSYARPAVEYGGTLKVFVDDRHHRALKRCEKGRRNDGRGEDHGASVTTEEDAGPRAAPTGARQGQRDAPIDEGSPARDPRPVLAGGPGARGCDARPPGRER